VYPYLLRGLVIDRPNQVWCADITPGSSPGAGSYPDGQGVRLFGRGDWFSRRVLAWRVSITLETDFCVEALQDAMNRHGQPEIFNSPCEGGGQGVQFTSAAFLGELETLGVRISMDGKARFLDNIFIERLWRSLKYEEVFIKAYGSVPEARIGIGEWLTFYNDERPHQALGYRTPTAVFHGAASNHMDNASASLSRYPYDYWHNNHECICSSRLNDRFAVQDSTNCPIRIGTPSCCGTDDRSNASEQIGTPLGTEAAGDFAVCGCRSQFPLAAIVVGWNFRMLQEGE
jgi:putative transposase